MTTPSVHTKKKAVILDGAYGFYSWLIPIVGAYIFMVGSSAMGAGLLGGILWMAIYFYWGFEIVPNTDYIVIERFGEFNRIVHSGLRILCLPGIIDKIADKGTLRYKEKALFADAEKQYYVDFRDGSTPVIMKASYRVGPQTDSVEDLDDAIYRFTYTMRSNEEREERIEEILESSVIPLLQALEIGQALLQKDAIAEIVTKDKKVLGALEAMGVELNDKKGLIITDIDLTPEIIEQRQKKLEGASEAEKQSAQGLGYARSIVAIMKELAISEYEARSIYETQRGLETLEKVQSNISFVAPDLKGVHLAMGIGNVRHT